jgi:hypothetical protein
MFETRLKQVSFGDMLIAEEVTEPSRKLDDTRRCGTGRRRDRGDWGSLPRSYQAGIRLGVSTACSLRQPVGETQLRASKQHSKLSERLAILWGGHAT